MGVVKEWKCSYCGNEFESDIQICPNCGCVELTRIFLSPIAIKGDRTKMKDRSLDLFAKEYGLTDFSNNLSTKHDPKTTHEWKDVKEVLDDPAAALPVSNTVGNILQKTPKDEAMIRTSQLVKDLSAHASKPIKNPIIVNPERKAAAGRRAQPRRRAAV